MSISPAIWLALRCLFLRYYRFFRKEKLRKKQPGDISDEWLSVRYSFAVDWFMPSETVPLHEGNPRKLKKWLLKAPCRFSMDKRPL